MDISPEEFKEIIKVIFNETEGSEWYKKFEEKFDKITKEDRQNNR